MVRKNPIEAKCDAASQLNLDHYESLLATARRVRQAIITPEHVGTYPAPNA